MKLNSKTGGTLTAIMILSVAVGTLMWAIVERLALLAGFPFSLSVGPVGVDIGVAAVSFLVNPGTLAGVFIGLRIFRSV